MARRKNNIGEGDRERVEMHFRQDIQRRSHRKDNIESSPELGRECSADLRQRIPGRRDSKYKGLETEPPRAYLRIRKDIRVPREE